MLKNPLLILFSCLYHIHIIKQSTFSSSFVRTLFLYIFLLLLFWCGQLFYHKVVLSSLQIILSQTVNYSNTNSFFFFDFLLFFSHFSVWLCFVCVFFFEKAIYKNILYALVYKEVERMKKYMIFLQQNHSWTSGYHRTVGARRNEKRNKNILPPNIYKIQAYKYLKKFLSFSSMCGSESLQHTKRGATKRQYLFKK